MPGTSLAQLLRASQVPVSTNDALAMSGSVQCKRGTYVACPSAINHMCGAEELAHSATDYEFAIALSNFRRAQKCPYDTRISHRRQRIVFITEVGHFRASHTSILQTLAGYEENLRNPRSADVST